MNIFLLYVSLPLIIISLMILVLTILARRENPTHKHFYFLCITILVWNITHALFSVAVDLNTAQFFFSLQMIAIPFMPVALLLFVFKIVGLDRAASLKPAIALCILPFITIILNFTNSFHNLFRTEFAILQIEPVRLIINERGPWFWVHTVYSYGLIFLAVGVILFKIKGLAKASRLQYYMVLVGSLLSTLINLLVIIFPHQSPMDSTLLGSTFSLLFLYYAIGIGPSSGYVMARNRVFEAIGEYIFVLNKDDAITDINTSARNWLARNNIHQDPHNLDALLEQLQKNGATIENNLETGRWEVFFLDDKHSLFSSYAIKSKRFYNKKNEIVGTVVTFSDMTAIRETLRNLQAVSAIDELTGTYNRRGYEKKLEEYDNEERLPLCLIMGDVNGLKRVNDNFGHALGDQVLRRTAQLLVECVGEDGAVARFGGDEFAVILPNYGEIFAERLLSNIKRTFLTKGDELHGAGIALGYALKTHTSQKLSTVMDEADKNMYADKRNDRRRR